MWNLYKTIGFVKKNGLLKAAVLKDQVYWRAFVPGGFLKCCSLMSTYYSRMKSWDCVKFILSAITLQLQSQEDSLQSLDYNNITQFTSHFAKGMTS